MTARTTSPRRRRRLVIAVCPREPGTVALAVTAGHLVTVREACAGGCTGTGPNVSVTMYPAPRPGAPPSQVAIDWKTYVYSLRTLPCLAAVIDDNLLAPPSQ